MSEIEDRLNEIENLAKQLSLNLHEMRISVQKGVVRENETLREEMRRLRDENEQLRSTHRTVNRLLTSTR